MKINTLLKPWIKLNLADVEITGLHNDSRQIQPGFLFFAYPGAVTDGRLYISQAVKAGAVAVLYEPQDWPEICSLPEKVLTIPFPDLASYLAAIASRFYAEPTKKVKVTGITGTNGKTTIAYQLAQAHELLATKSVYIGTIGQGQVSSLQPLTNTTPDALCLQRLVYTYEQLGVKQISMEVSSHALAQQRVASMHFNQAIFSNLTHDHLDYHHNMQAYAAAKASLFTYPGLKWGIVNNDDNYAPLFKEAITASCKLITYGLQEGSDVRALNWEVTLKGTMIDLESPWGRYQLKINALGFFNIYNALAVFTSLLAYGYDAQAVVAVMAKLQPAPGRMEVVVQRPYIIVDYAHTPDALENVLLTLNNVKKGRIIVVFGCGGDRDKTKRPIMGNIAAQLADIAIITSDNPRSESPQQIINHIEQGINTTNSKIYSIVDREEAIATAINFANEDDIVLIAGKGHEAYQQIGQNQLVFCDQDVVRRLVAKKVNLT